MSQSYHEHTNKACTFPAAALRWYRAALVDQIGHLEQAGLYGSPRFHAMMSTIMAIDRLYGEHQGIDACSTCWWTPAETAIAARCI